ncbi:DUF6506 family protein [Chloroflexota bacterium]
MLKAVHMFVVPDFDSKKHRAKFESPTISMTIVGVKDFDEGADIAKSLVEEGIQLIELCGAWGAVGCTKIIQAVGDKVAVGHVVYGAEQAPQLAPLV